MTWNVGSVGLGHSAGGRWRAGTCLAIGALQLSAGSCESGSQTRPNRRAAAPASSATAAKPRASRHVSQRPATRRRANQRPKCVDGPDVWLSRDALYVRQIKYVPEAEALITEEIVDDLCTQHHKVWKDWVRCVSRYVWGGPFFYDRKTTHVLRMRATTSGKVLAQSAFQKGNFGRILDARGSRLLMLEDSPARALRIRDLKSGETKVVFDSPRKEHIAAATYFRHCTEVLTISEGKSPEGRTIAVLRQHNLDADVPPRILHTFQKSRRKYRSVPFGRHGMHGDYSLNEDRMNRVKFGSGVMVSSYKPISINTDSGVSLAIGGNTREPRVAVYAFGDLFVFRWVGDALRPLRWWKAAFYLDEYWYLTRPAIAISPKARYVALHSIDQVIRIADVEGGQLHTVLDVRGSRWDWQDVTGAGGFSFTKDPGKYVYAALRGVVVAGIVGLTDGIRRRLPDCGFHYEGSLKTSFLVAGGQYLVAMDKGALWVVREKDFRVIGRLGAPIIPLYAKDYRELWYR